MFKKIKKIIALSNKDLSKISDEQIRDLPEEPDGKAVFFGEGSEEEFKDLENEKKGIKGIFGL